MTDVELARFYLGISIDSYDVFPPVMTERLSDPIDQHIRAEGIRV